MLTTHLALQVLFFVIHTHTHTHAHSLSIYLFLHLSVSLSHTHISPLQSPATPVPLNPLLQWHLKDEFVLTQTALMSQLWLFSLHSWISEIPQCRNRSHIFTSLWNVPSLAKWKIKIPCVWSCYSAAAFRHRFGRINIGRYASLFCDELAPSDVRELISLPQ